MDSFSRFVNPHVFGKLLSLYKVDSNLWTSMLLQTRLYEQLKGIISDECIWLLNLEIQNQQQSDDLQSKLDQSKPLLELIAKKVSPKQLGDFIAENLWIVEQLTEALIIKFDMGQYEEVSEIVEKLNAPIENNEKLSHLRSTYQWAKLNTKLIRIFSGLEEHQKLISSVFDDIRQIEDAKNAHDLTFKIRADLLHIGFLLAFQSEDFTTFLEIFSNDNYLEVVYSLKPYFLNYFAIALLFNKAQFTGTLTLNNISSSYKESALLEFLDKLLTKFDFDAANSLINKIEEEARIDILAKNIAAQLKQACKLYFFSTYIKIFNKIKISTFAKYHNIDNDNAEVWLVEAIRTLKINAKIDTDLGVIMVQKHGRHNQNEHLMNSLRELMPRQNMLISNIARLSVQE